MTTPFRDRAVLNVLDLGKQPLTRAVLVCSGDNGAVAPFMVGVDRVYPNGDADKDGFTFVEGYRDGSLKPVILLSHSIPFVVFDRSILEILTFADRAKLMVEDEKGREELLKEHDPDSAAVLAAQRSVSRASVAALMDKGVTLEVEDTRPHGQYL